MAQGSVQPASTYEHMVRFLSSRLRDWYSPSSQAFCMHNRPLTLAKPAASHIEWCTYNVNKETSDAHMSTLCRPSVHGCLTGITGLQAAGATQLQTNHTSMLVKSLLEVQVTSLAQADRMMALTILHKSLQVDQLSPLFPMLTVCKTHTHRTQFKSAISWT